MELLRFSIDKFQMNLREINCLTPMSKYQIQFELSPNVDVFIDPHLKIHRFIISKYETKNQ